MLIIECLSLRPKCVYAAATAATKSLQSCPTLCDPIDSSPPSSLSLAFSRQEHCSRLPFPSPRRESEVAQFSSVKFSHLAMSDSLRPHELQPARPPCPSPTPGVYSNSCPQSGWCHPVISSSVIPFSFCPQSLPASGSFPMSQLFTLGGQSIGVSASATVLPVNTQDWSPLGRTGWISLQSKGLSESSPIPQFKSINSLALSFLHSSTLTPIHDHWKNHSLDQTDLGWQIMSLLFNMLPRLVIAFLPRSKHLLFIIFFSLFLLVGG